MHGCAWLLLNEEVGTRYILDAFEDFFIPISAMTAIARYVGMSTLTGGFIAK